MVLQSLRARLLVAAVATLSPSIAFAHAGIGVTSDFAHGLLHPLTGIDHILAMVAVGIFAYQIGGRALWLVPAAFISGMALGGALGMSGINVPHVELGIALSVIILGFAVALGTKAPIAAVFGVIGLMAMFHGHAHGVEIPENASGFAYLIGFMGATGLLHLCGIGIGLLIGRARQSHAPGMVRVAGGLMTVAGVGILTGTI